MPGSPSTNSEGVEPSDDNFGLAERKNLFHLRSRLGSGDLYGNSTTHCNCTKSKAANCATHASCHFVIALSARTRPYRMIKSCLNVSAWSGVKPSFRRLRETALLRRF